MFDLCNLKKFAPLIFGLDGLVLSSNNKPLCFRIQASCSKLFVSHMLVNIFLTYSPWVFAMHWVLSFAHLFLCMMLWFFFGLPSLDDWGFILGMQCVREVKILSEHCCLVSY